MRHTSYMHLREPEQTDVFSEADINYNVEIIDQNIKVLNTKLGGMSFERLSQAAYDALLVRDWTKMYVVVGDGTVTLYLGDIKIGSGSGEPVSVSLGTFAAPVGTAGHGTVEEV